jgi:hypothetical protein
MHITRLGRERQGVALVVTTGGEYVIGECRDVILCSLEDTLRLQEQVGWLSDGRVVYAIAHEEGLNKLREE